MTQSGTSSIKLRHGAGVSVRLIGVAAALGFSYIFWRASISGFPAVIWFSFAALVILFCLAFGGATILWIRSLAFSVVIVEDHSRRMAFGWSVWLSGPADFWPCSGFTPDVMARAQKRMLMRYSWRRLQVYHLAKRTWSDHAPQRPPVAI